ncbi:response regulator [Ramlibacter ginsenosidimutans]|uniref:Virulence sensor protein BvgS n=2 Tax=Ramlibacter ginsenosidimutans TaxID=502333 RepID=A0A934WNS1_9BURK|nr:response regulator [Ramlibacter ginsenosidimutans]MBK6009199.1 response regulator [Ramlibacter ginsenosidimutans]
MLIATPNDPGVFRRILTRNVTLPLSVGLLSALLFITLIVYLMQSQRWVERSDLVISRAYASETADLELETSLRGYLLAGEERFLDRFEPALVAVRSEVNGLKAMVQDEPEQVQRLDRILALQATWNDYARQRIGQMRADPNYRIGAGTGEGKRIKDAVREEYDRFIAGEQRLRQQRTDAANRNAWITVIAFAVFTLATGIVLAWRGRRDLLGLSGTYDAAFQEQQRQAEALAAQAWLREGQSLLSEQLAREQDLGSVGHAALEFLAGTLGITVGALYVPEPGGFARAASWGWAPEAAAAGEHIPADRTLVAECASQRRQIALDDVPAGYLQVNSSLGATTARSVLISPVEHEGRLAGVLEIGLLRPLAPRDGEMLKYASGILGASLEAARYRKRLQDVLEETQQLNEELQVQQEELRTANEELEEQSRALKESQAHLESQQAELEQTNLQLSEQADRLEQQRDQLRTAQAQLEERATELQRASRYKSEFLANMSHELRTPLNSSLILAKLLADNAEGNLSEEQVRFAESIYNAGNDLLTLINDILDIAKVEAGKLEMRPEVMPVRSLCEGLRSMFEPLARRKGLSLQVVLAPDLPDSLYTDRHRLEQILRNLLANAIKFTDHGTVALHVALEADRRIRFEVRDSGIGIPPSQQELIFEAFRQADGTASRKYAGTGLGLSISRDLARLLGGDIAVESTPGQGSTFSVALPLEYRAALAQQPLAMVPPGTDNQQAARPVATPAPAATKPAGPAPTRPPAPSFPDDREAAAEGRRTVLVVEDDARFARILFDLAHELGYRCLVAHDAREGMELAQAQVPDAVLLDILLPDETGLAVLQRLKADPRTRHIPVHALSAEDRSEPALQLGAIGYARKPASREDLQEVFRRLEEKLSQKLKRVLLVEDDPRQQESVRALIGDGDIEIVAAAQGTEALAALSDSVFDCMIIDLKLPDMSGQELLRRMAAGESRSFPPVIVYTGRNLTRDEEAELLRYSRSIIIKGARSPERLLDEVTLFLHKVETQLSSERQKMLRTARSRDKAFEARRILVVDDDMRNIFALTSALEQKGAEVEVARNGVEALRKLEENPDGIDLVLMDIMMPEMDGLTATREIRKNPRWQKLPVIAVTAKAMKEDQEKALAAGANDYLAKPIELERLFSLMRVWMPKLERML